MRFLHRERLRQDALRDVAAIRNAGCAPVPSELPAMERTLDAIAAHAAQGEVPAEMRAECGHDVRLPTLAPPQHELASRHSR